MKWASKLLIIFFTFFCYISLTQKAFAQNLNQILHKGVINEVISSEELNYEALTRYNQTLIVEIKNSQTNQTFTKEIILIDSPIEYKLNDNVQILEFAQANAESEFYISDYDRTQSLVFLLFIFVLVVFIVSKGYGLLSIVGMGYSFFIILWYLLPKLLEGSNPIITTLIAVSLIMPVTFILSHGFNKKTFISVVATLASLTITALLAYVFIDLSHLSGFGSEEAYFLQIAQKTINIKGILLAGIIVGTLGILDDATVTQASIVKELKVSNPKLQPKEVFSKAMKVGHDHIASTVNTLILVYTGASLPLLLLFINFDQPFMTVINTELIAEEIVTMLVSSIGLILSIPITTFIAAYSLDSKANENYHAHVH